MFGQLEMRADRGRWYGTHRRKTESGGRLRGAAWL